MSPGASDAEIIEYFEHPERYTSESNMEAFRDLEHSDQEFLLRVHKEISNVDPRVKREYCEFVIASARAKRDEITIKLEDLDSNNLPDYICGKEWKDREEGLINHRVDSLLENQSQ